jgi:hypothetical protein
MFLKKHIDMIENIQRRATKLIPGLSNLSYEDRIRRLKLPSLSYRRSRGDMIEVYKIMSGKYDPEISNIFQPWTSSVSAESDSKLSCPVVITAR